MYRDSFWGFVLGRVTICAHFAVHFNFFNFLEKPVATSPCQIVGSIDLLNMNIVSFPTKCVLLKKKKHSQHADAEFKEISLYVKYYEVSL